MRWAVLIILAQQLITPAIPGGQSFPLEPVTPEPAALLLCAAAFVLLGVRRGR